MNFPSEYFFIAGLLLLVIAFVRLIIWAVKITVLRR
jgi:flagellar biogenesis protein FliO